MQQVFNPDQKAILRRLQELPKGYKFIGNAIDVALPNTSIEIDFINKKAYILVEDIIEMPNDYKEYYHATSVYRAHYIIESSFVIIDALKNQNLANVIQTPYSLRPAKMKIGQAAKNIPVIRTEITDQSKLNSLLQLASYEIELDNRIDPFL